ncbi:ribosomal L1 domain-containing protein 1-like [Anolis sagrei]|uniref:ribosomal L1 domain-containing protein 1-like n=1 Tax=Anolis sagrei TaxID=38937 RepID=UPI003521984F
MEAGESQGTLCQSTHYKMDAASVAKCDCTSLSLHLRSKHSAFSQCHYFVSYSPLPHNIQPATAEVCLFTKDEPDLTAEQTENLYKKLLSQHGITSITEVISYKTLKKKYKPFEAKHCLLSRFALFLSDDRIRRLLPSHIGKHFYRSKNSVHIGHTGMEAGQISANVITAANVIATKAPQIWRSVKILHLKTVKSFALPVFTWIHPNSDTIQKETDTERQCTLSQRKKEKNKTKNIAKENSSTIADESDASDAKGTILKTADISFMIESEEDDGDIEASPIANGEKVLDDDFFCAHSEEDLQATLNTFAEAYEKLG